MKKTTLFERSIIANFLNAHDKIKIMANLSKDWRILVYSGYAWNSLFNDQIDQSWALHRISGEMIKLFKHLNGIKQIYISKHLINMIPLLEQFLDQFQHIRLDSYLLADDVKKICKNAKILEKVDKFPHGVTKYHMAASHGHLNILSNALRVEKIDINKLQNFWGSTLLHYAAKSGKESVIKFLIYNGAKVNATDIDGNTPLHQAVRYGHLSSIRILLQLKANRQIQNKIGDKPQKMTKSQRVIDQLLNDHPKKFFTFNNRYIICPKKATIQCTRPLYEQELQKVIYED